MNTTEEYINISIDKCKLGSFGFYIDDFKIYYDQIYKNVDSIHRLNHKNKKIDILEEIKDMQNCLEDTNGCKVLTPPVDDNDLIDEIITVIKIRRVFKNNFFKYTTYYEDNPIFVITLKDNVYFNFKIKETSYTTKQLIIIKHYTYGSDLYMHMDKHIAKHTIKYPIKYNTFVDNICTPLQILHKNRIYHGDIKEKNIVINFNNDKLEMKFIDYSSCTKPLLELTSTAGTTIPFMAYKLYENDPKIYKLHYNKIFDWLDKINNEIFASFVLQREAWNVEIGGKIEYDLLTDYKNKEASINMINNYSLSNYKLNWKLYLKLKNDEFGIAIICAKIIYYYKTILAIDDINLYTYLIKQLLHPKLYFYKNSL